MGSTEEKTPKSYQVRLTNSALQNIEDITSYIAYINHQPLNAIMVGDGIYHTIDRIGRTPFAFRECEEMPTKNKIYRKAVCKSWLIIYRIKQPEVVIIGVLYASRRASKIRRFRKIK